jgi:3,4-dihydroxy 2-butanone 4-phosphate synthase/GTP cyclohydrolase II
MDFFHSWLGSAESFSRRHKRPLVTLSYAQSLDGSIAVQRGSPTAISAEASYIMTHQLRSAHDAILVGIGTVLSDNPRLTVRLVEGPSPQPIILDTRLRTPIECRVMQGHSRKPWLAAAREAPQNKLEMLESAGAQGILLPVDIPGGINLPALLESLWKKGVFSLMVEGGAAVITSFLRQGLVDYAVITLAPVFIGGFNVLTNGNLSQGEGFDISGFPGLVHPEFQQYGKDFVIWGEVQYP